MQSLSSRRSCINYLDDRIQGYLLFATLMLDMLLLVIAIVILYFHLSQAIEEQMFRVHFGPQEGLPVLVKGLLQIAPFVVLAKIMIALIVKWLWSDYIARIVSYLKATFYAITLLDLRLRQAPQANHEVLDKAEYWLQEEHQRCTRLGRLLEDLDVDKDEKEVAMLLQKMRKYLPSGEA